MLKLYSLTTEQKAVIEERLGALLEVCQIYDVPMFATVAISNSETSTEYNNIIYSAKAHNLDLTDDKIARHILVADNFRVVPPRDVAEFDMSEIEEDFD